MVDDFAKVLTLPEQQTYGRSQFPYAYACQRSGATADDAAAWFHRSRRQLLSEATEHGAILFRGYPLCEATHFDAVITALGLENFPYRESLSNAVRTNFTERVFSANEAPSEVRIFLHHEMAQTPLFPQYILFFCEVAASSGGATPICRSDVLFEQLERACPNFVDSLISKGLKYSHVMPGDDDPESGMGRSWQSTLAVGDRAAAESRLSQLQYHWQWLENDCLRVTTPALPAVREIAPGRRTLFNQLIAAYSGWQDQRNDISKSIRHGDDSRLDASAVHTMIELADRLSFDIAWQPGDVALLDNTVAMHGRRTFSGKRRVLASLAEMKTHEFPIASA